MFYTDTYTLPTLLSTVSQINTLISYRVYKVFILYMVNIGGKEFILLMVVKFEFLCVLCDIRGF